MTTFRGTVGLLGALAVLSLGGCGGGSSGGGNIPGVITLALSPNPVTLPVNSAHTFTATTNAPVSQVLWVLVEAQEADVGTPSNQIGGPTFDYVAPASPPVYKDFIQTAGTVILRALVGTQEVEETFTITAPSITTGITSFFSSVALSKTLTINAYAVGSTSNGLTLQVNGIAGGSATVGTVVAFGGIYGQYVYTAPATMPMTGKTVTITVVSQADPTKTASETVTLM